MDSKSKSMKCGTKLSKPCLRSLLEAIKAFYGTCRPAENSLIETLQVVS